jgi:nucleoside-diphosphate-sugar epimerase
MTSSKAYTIDTSKPVLVTGATGYLAGPLVADLLKAGVTVHATVRDPSNKEKLKPLNDVADASPGSLKFFKADLLEAGGFETAMKGCSVIFHTASPAMFAPKDPMKDLVEPAVKGTESVLLAANKTPSVKRVVLTSSVVAAMCDASDASEGLTEENWNRTATLEYQPYTLSKTLAEQKAWVIAGSQTQWKLVVVNPGFLMGPGIGYLPSSESSKAMKQFLDGTLASGAPNLFVPLVDIRDVSAAHIAAAYKEDVSGRHFILGHNTSLMEVASVLLEKYPNYPIPKRKLPKLLVWLIGPWIPDEAMERRYVTNNVDVKGIIDNGKSIKELGMVYRPMKETLHDMAQQFIDLGIVKKL